MAVITDKVLVVFLDATLADDGNDAPGMSAAAAAATTKAFDEVATRGSNGFLVLPDVPQDAQGALSSLEHLLSVEHDATGVRFKFPKMPVAFFSASADACALAHSLKFDRVVDTNAPNTESLAAAKELLDGDTKQLVFVHTRLDKSEWIHDLVRDVLQQQEGDDGDSRVFVALVQTARAPHDPQANASVFRPRQSFEKIDGTYPRETATSDSALPRRLLYSFYQKDRTRRDSVDRFDEAQIDARGCYGAMSARMVLKEMAFRIGFAPKYGA